MFWFFGREACGSLAPRPGIEPARPALEGEVLTTHQGSLHGPLKLGLIREVLPKHVSLFRKLTVLFLIGIIFSSQCLIFCERFLTLSDYLSFRNLFLPQKEEHFFFF